MTTIRVIRSANGFTVIADGHACAPRNEDGRDLVCCSISCLLTTLANSCAQLDGVQTIYKTTSGMAELYVSNTLADPAGIDARLQMAVDGLTGLAQQYPQSIRMTVE